MNKDTKIIKGILYSIFALYVCTCTYLVISGFIAGWTVAKIVIGGVGVLVAYFAYIGLCYMEQIEEERYGSCE